jgi:hypothetical protein
MSIIVAYKIFTVLDAISRYYIDVLMDNYLVTQSYGIL